MSKSYKVFLLVRKITEKKREMYIIIRINFHFWKISRKCVSIHSVKFTPPIANVWRFFILGTKKTRLPEHWWLNQPAKVGVEQIYWQYSKWVWSQFTVNVIWSKLLTLRHILPIQQTYIYIALIFFFLVIRFIHSLHRLASPRTQNRVGISCFIWMYVSFRRPFRFSIRSSW